MVAVVAGLGSACPASAADQAGRDYEQAKRLVAKRDYEAALALLNEAVRLEPRQAHQAKYRGLRGAVWLYKGDYAKGAADLKAAIEANPGDAGVGYRPSRGAALSAEAIRHGRAQVAAMLRDRPPMAQYGEEAKFLRDWAERKFAGEDFGEPIDWDPTPPLHSDAEHLAPSDGDNAAILVELNYSGGPKEGKPRSFEELWAGAIFELHNVSFAKEFVRLNNEANEGKLSKEAFVDGILRYELQAAQRTRAFYLQVWLPWAEKKKLATDPSLWFCDWWDTVQTVLKSFTNRSAYPWRPYARVHDWATVHRFWRRGGVENAQKLLEKMREEDYDDELSDVAYWIGRCLIRQNKPKEAMEALNEAIEYDAGNAAAYRARGELYKKQGDKKKAEADLEKAKKLESEE
jgi:tetratricopeptide (TPR) repeat protein